MFGYVVYLSIRRNIGLKRIYRLQDAYARLTTSFSKRRSQLLPNESASLGCSRYILRCVFKNCNIPHKRSTCVGSARLLHKYTQASDLANLQNFMNYTMNRANRYDSVIITTI